MKDYLYLSELYDIYKPLLTEKQQKYFEDYYFENFSLQEISENHQVSKNAVSKQLKEIARKLLWWEAKLAFHRKRDMVLLSIKDAKTKARVSEILEE